MVKKSKSKAPNGRVRARNVQMNRVSRPARGLVRTATQSYETKLLKMITDPCGAELVPGLGLPANGICQRFTRYIRPVGTTEDNFAFVVSPNNQSPASGIVQKLSTGGGAASNAGSGLPGETFLEANAEAVATLGFCIEVLYTGKLVDRRGYVGVCQAPWSALNDIQAATTPLTDVLTYCQSVSPVTSQCTRLMYSPTMLNFTQNAFTLESGQNAAMTGLMVVVVGVHPADFIVRFTHAVEYIPKNLNGIPAPRATKTIPLGTGERVVSALDRMGHWWHNLGDAAGAAYRLGGSMVYGATQAARFVRAASSAIEPATALLALTG